jgi:alkylation response protein AidB-like acyl-CoA dehydrogenase
MGFTFSAEQKMTAGVVRDLLAAECTTAQLRKQLDSKTARDQSRWAKLSEIGLPGVLAPADSGGLALAESDFVLIAEECGYACLPEPLVEQAGIVVPLLASLSPNEAVRHWLPRVGSGEATIVLGHPINPFVADADTADALLLTDANALHLVARHDVRLTFEPSIDPFRRLFRVDWTPTESTRIACGETVQHALSQALDRGALFAAAQCLGIAQRCNDIAVDYAKERKQFGKPIASYQAVKHLAANVQVKIEFARPVVHAAAVQIGNFDRFSKARVSHAKLAATEAANFAGRMAIQIHGAMGYSWDVDIHFFLKRALALTGAWGTAQFHNARVAQRMFDAPLGADQTFAKESFRG